MNRRTRAVASLLAFTMLAPSTPTIAQWAVLDGGNLVQNTVSAIQDVNAVLKQVEQYKTQLDDYAAHLRDLAAPAVWVWDLGTDTVATAERVQKKLTDYRQLIGDTHQSLAQLGDPNYYRSSPCYNRQGTYGGCGAFLEAMQEQQRRRTQTQYEANEALFDALDAQHNSMNDRLKRLKKLVKTSQAADGQLKALQAANQLTSAQIAELMEIRSLLIAQQNVAVEAKRAEMADQAAAQAASSSFFSGEHKATTSPKGW
jgi:type IV secretion system protein TrbJ